MNKRIRKKKEKQRHEWFHSARAIEAQQVYDRIFSYQGNVHVIVTVIDEEPHNERSS